MSERYSVKDYYIWDNVEQCQVITFDGSGRIFADNVCALLNEHEVMKNFLCGFGKAIMEV